MKNRILILTAWLLSVGGLVSCSDVLDEAPSGKISLEEVFQDNDKTMYYLNTCYSSLPNKGLHYFFWSRGPVEWCDDAWDGDDLDVNWAASALLYSGNASASSHPVWAVAGENLSMNYWTNYFARIRNCGVFLQHIPTAEVNSETDRSRWAAEAHLLRAYYYSELLLWFGCSLPVIKEPYTLDDDFSQVKRGSYYEVVRFILEDCDAALSCPDLPWRIDTPNEAMRVTKALAWAIKSRMSLFAASPLYNDGNNYWEEAFQVNQQALKNLEDNKYELYNKVNAPAIYASERAYLPNDYASLYNEYFCTSGDYSASPVDRETIFQLVNNNGDVSNVDGIGAICGYKTGTCPSQELVDAYETIDGQPILDLSKPYLDEQHLKPNYNKDNTLYDPQHPYENRDPRFYASIYYNGAKRYCGWSKAETPTCFENYPADAGTRTRIIATWARYQDASGDIVEEPEPLTGRKLTDRIPTRSGYFERKFLHPNSGMENRLGGARHKDYRLGEIILNYAEAAMEAGHEDVARTQVNRIRARVGMPPIPASVTGEALRLRIRNERRVELAMEGNRYFDVRRWQRPDGDLSATDHWVTSAYITRNNDGSYTYDRAVIHERQCYDNKWLKVAIPLSEVNNMIALTGENWQNPGW